MAAGASWTRGPGASGILAPLIGDWTTEADGPAGGRITVTRRFAPVLGGSHVQLDARWLMGPGQTYEEIALFGTGADGVLAFTSFTADGKQSRGQLADGTDIHPQAIAFEAQMPAGLARFVYWPAEEGDGYRFAVESWDKPGWNRFVSHHYRRGPTA